MATVLKVNGYLFGQVPGFAAQIITYNIYKYRPGFNFIFATVKSRRMRWAGHVARVGEESVQCFVGKQKERDHSEDKGVDGRMRSEWILVRLGGSVKWIQLAHDRGTVACSIYDDEAAGSGTTELVS
jgi:hypothetical protein